jgi:hypothetical protein
MVISNNYKIWGEIMNIQCDRCKSIYDNSGEVTFHEDDEYRYFLVTEIIYSGIRFVYEDNKSKYLCPKCTKELRDWIEGK